MSGGKKNRGSGAHPSEPNLSAPGFEPIPQNFNPPGTRRAELVQITCALLSNPSMYPTVGDVGIVRIADSILKEVDKHATS